MRRRIVGFIVIALLGGASLATAQDKGTEWGENEILSYLGELIAWHRDAAVVDTATKNARELLLQDSMQQQTTKALQYGFTFARAAAPVIDAGRDTAADAETGDAQAQARQKKFNDMIAANEQDIVRLKQRLNRGTATQREQAQVELTFAQARQKLFQTVKANVEGLGDGNGLAGKIENLARSVPEVAQKSKTTATDTSGDSKPAGEPNVTIAAPETDRPRGMFSLIGALYTAGSKQTALQHFEQRTEALIATNRSLLANLRVSLDNAAQQGTELVGGNRNAAAMAQHRRELEALVGQFNQVSDSIVPLVKAMRWLDTAKRTAVEWRGVIEKQIAVLTRQLMLRLAILAMAVAIPLLISELTRRAIERYTRDPRRRRQLHAARRIVAALVILLVVVMNFITEFGSFITFAGFITAGLAVALQSVLLSLVAHFFFYGRYGVRAGDMITVAGVTGEILQVGMMRLYLREMEKGEDGQLAPTGKMVAFPNSILFQPTAFYKYIEYPG
jgi:hypothetical protein